MRERGEELSSAFVRFPAVLRSAVAACSSGRVSTGLWPPSSMRAGRAGCRALGGPDVLRLTPPLIVSPDDVAEALRDDRERARGMNRRERQAAILGLVQARAISTQAELAQAPA